MTTITIDDELASLLTAKAHAKGQDLHQYSTALLRKALTSDLISIPVETDLAQLLATSRPFAPEAELLRYQEHYNIPDLAHLSDEELALEAERTIAAMRPEVRAELEQAGLL